MKRIKENLLLKTIPESATIQHVLESLVPAVFNKKSEAKYFLTVVGDNLLKKVGDQIHFVSAKMKPFLKELTTISQLLIGQNPAASFKHKYYEHAYQECRLLNVQDTVATSWQSILQKYALDILCVAAHYSHRYKSADTFLQNSSNDDVLVEYALYLSKNTPNTLIRVFIDETLCLLRKDRSPSFGEIPQLSKSVNFTNMQYLWRQFLQSKHLPNVMFQNTFKAILIDILGDRYDAEQEAFLDITSKYLPAVQRFLSFWDDTMQVSVDVLAEYEVDEIATLYKQWCVNTGQSVLSLNDAKILDLIRFYYPDVEIEGDKYIQNIRCKLWDKALDVQVAMESTKESVSSTYDAYGWYRKFYEGSKYLVSKGYFEKYLHETGFPTF
jgi:hypothetical protein